MDRRILLQGAATVAATGALPGCSTFQPPTVIGTGDLVDAHCHIFNASDLPIVRFLKRVVLERFPEQSAFRTLDVRDPDTLDELLKLVRAILGANKAPLASSERRVLEGELSAQPKYASLPEATDEAIADTATYLRDLERRARAPSVARKGRSGATKMLDAFQRAAGVQPGAERTFADSSDDVAKRAFASSFDLGALLKWFPLFKLYRHKLAETLVADHQAQGFRPILLTPATIDYDWWLGEDVKSPLADQVAVMGLIGRRATPCPIHGYFGYDPLREVAFRRGKDPASPLQLARSALLDHGFLGIKLYPPMGFRASGNVRPFPKEVTDKFGLDLGAQLDAALEDLYALCVELDAPILAHAYPSNQASEGYGMRADPAYWLPVFARHPALRVCLAHFGRFDKVSAARPAGTTLPEASWEWTFGRHLEDRPGAPVFADLSYFSEVLGAGPDERKTLVENFRKFFTRFDPRIENLVFGSDFVMLGKEPNYRRYASVVNAFLKNECGLPEDARKRFFAENALRLTGLSRGARARERLLAFYRRHGLDPARLPSV